MKRKTKKAAAKRFKLSATGKIRYKKAGLRHNMGNKASKRKRKMSQPGQLFEGNRRHIEGCLPYGSIL